MYEWLERTDVNMKLTESLLSLSPEYERKVLQCVLKNNYLIHTAKRIINADTFTRPQYKEIWIILENEILNKKRSKVDSVYIFAHYINNNQLKTTTQNSFYDILNEFATEPCFKTYLYSMKEIETKQKLAILCTELAQINKVNKNYKEYISKKKLEFDDIIDNYLGSKLEDDVQHPEEYTKKAVNYYTSQDKIKKEKIYTGFANFDEISKGLHSLTLLSAPTGIGKTLFGINLFFNIAHLKKIPCFYINYEMEKQDFLDRIMRIATNLNIKEFSNKCDIIVNTLADINKYKTMIWTGNKSKTITDTCSLIYTQWIKYNIKVVFIDYIGEIEPDDLALKERNEYYTYGRYAQHLKNFCSDLGIKCFLIAQIGREGDENPKRKHIQGSWKLIQKADLMAILYYESINDNYEYTLKIEKNRHGPSPMEIKLNFDKQSFRFAEKGGTNDIPF